MVNNWFKSILSLFLDLRPLSAPKKFESQLKIKLNKKDCRWYKKIPLTSTRKTTPFLVEPDQNSYFKVRPYRKFVKVSSKFTICHWVSFIWNCHHKIVYFYRKLYLLLLLTSSSWGSDYPTQQLAIYTYHWKEEEKWVWRRGRVSLKRRKSGPEEKWGDKNDSLLHGKNVQLK